MLSCEEPCEHTISDTTFCDGRHYLSLGYLTKKYTVTNHTLDLSYVSFKLIHYIYLSKLLKFFPRLTTLNISNNIIHAEKLYAITNTLNHSPSLKCLSLNNAGLDSEGFNVISMLLRTNSYITSLDISNNCATVKEVRNIFTAMEINRTLLTLNFSMIASHKKIKFTSIYRMLCINKTLFHLNLSYNYIDSQNMSIITNGLIENETLTTLDLSNNKIGRGDDGGISKILMRNNTLIKLDLLNNNFRSEEVAEILGSLTTNESLQTLILKSNLFDERGIARINEMLECNTSLTDLNLSYNCFSGNISSLINSLSQSKGSLAILSLMNCQLGDQNVQAITDAMQKNTTITVLSLSSNKISKNTAPSISNMIIHNTTLERLDISENPMLVGENSILRALRYNNSIRRFDINYTYNYRVDDDDDEIRRFVNGELVKLFTFNHILSHISIPRASITNSETQELIHILTTNPTIMNFGWRSRFSFLYSEILFRNKHNKKEKRTSLFQLLFHHLCEEPIHLISEKKDI